MLLDAIIGQQSDKAGGIVIEEGGHASKRRCEYCPVSLTVALWPLTILGGYTPPSGAPKIVPSKVGNAYITQQIEGEVADQDKNSGISKNAASILFQVASKT
jgi:hypothetical protein